MADEVMERICVQHEVTFCPEESQYREQPHSAGRSRGLDARSPREGPFMVIDPWRGLQVQDSRSPSQTCRVMETKPTILNVAFT
jgi:hypothetical protein